MNLGPVVKGTVEDWHATVASACMQSHMDEAATVILLFNLIAYCFTHIFTLEIKQLDAQNFLVLQ